MISCAVIKKESLARAIVRLVRDSVFFSCKISGSSQVLFVLKYIVL